MGSKKYIPFCTRDHKGKKINASWIIIKIKLLYCSVYVYILGIYMNICWCMYDI